MTSILSSWWTLPDTIIGNFLNADWNAAWQQGRLAVVLGCWHALLGTNTSPFFVPVKGKGSASRARLKCLMRSNGIRAWGWGEFNGEIYWRVRRQQDWIVFNLLWRNGIRMLHRRGA